MNKLEAILAKSKAKGFESLSDECEKLNCVECSFEKIMGYCGASFIKKGIAEELLEPYEEPRKLTKRERAFCEYIQTGYIARDNYGVIWYKYRPKFIAQIGTNDCIKQYVCRDVFNFVKCEEEPYSVEELLKWEVED